MTKTKDQKIKFKDFGRCLVCLHNPCDCKKKKKETKDQKWELEFEQKVERFVIGILGQYGKPLSELSEVQIVCLKKDIKQLARGVLVEAERGQEKVIDNYLKK